MAKVRVNIQFIKNRSGCKPTHEACLACQGVGGKGVLLGKRPEAVGCQGRRGAHLWESLVLEALKQEEPVLGERKSAVWRHRRHSDLYRRVRVRGFHALP